MTAILRVAALAAVLALAACGGSGDEPKTTSEAELEAVAQNLQDVVLEGEWQKMRLVFVTSCIDAGGPARNCECAADEVELHPFAERPEIVSTPDDPRFRRIIEACS